MINANDKKTMTFRPSGGHFQVQKNTLESDLQKVEMSWFFIACFYHKMDWQYIIFEFWWRYVNFGEVKQRAWPYGVALGV